MPVIIYAVQLETMPAWHMTIAPAVDNHHWRSRRAIAFYQISPAIPISYAIPLLERLRDMHSPLADIERNLCRWAKEQQLPVVLMNQLSCQQVPALHVAPCRDGKLRSQPVDWSLFRRALAGKFLLLDEFADWLGQHGWNDPVSIAQMAYLKGYVDLQAAMGRTSMKASKIASWFGTATKLHVQCTRCGADTLHFHETECAVCGLHCKYCLRCINMGKARECTVVVHGGRVKSNIAQVNGDESDQPRGPILDALQIRWKLTPEQSEATLRALYFLSQRWTESQAFLLWAVTGAGKTEMILPLIDQMLRQRARPVVVTPRKDVVLELAPRIQKYFPDQRVIALYGGSPDRGQAGDITVSTTHQMMRFKDAFDLLIIDEIDAFPYHNNPMLEHVVQQARTKTGKTVWLSATPPESIIRLIKRGVVECAIICHRFHRQPLPEPKRISTTSIAQQIRIQTLDRSVIQCIKQSIERGAQLFIFVPHIKHAEPLSQLLQDRMSDFSDMPIVIAATSSKDELRVAKVQQFRNRDIRIMVTTTILERGVTVPFVDVMVMQADHEQFDQATLIQIAGRAGRSATDPHGLVWFCAAHWTRSQQAACERIRMMNKLAKDKRYI